ncbi:MAG: MFS transporter [Candidatus Coatesbacteria bacterium]
MFSPLLDLVSWATVRVPGHVADRLRGIGTQFRGLSRNAQILALTSFFWTLPTAFSVVYLRIFMREQGLSEIEIGTISSTQVLFQIAGSFCGGWIADRIGWKRALVFLDLCLWPTAMICYATATSYTGFLAGACVEGFQWVVVPAWISLLLSGTPRARRPFLFALGGLNFMGGGLLVPLGAPLVRAWGVSNTVRGIFVFGAALMITGIAIRWRTVKDRTPGHAARRVRRAGLRGLLHGHGHAFRTILARPVLRLMFFYQLLMRMAIVVGFTYGYLYLTDPRGLALDKARISVLPLINSAMVVAALVFINPMIRLARIHRFFYLGLGLRMTYLLAIVLAPAGALWIVMGAMVAEGLGFGILWSTANTYWANQMRDDERPRITALANVLFMVMTAPAPAIAGALYVHNPRAPFVMMLAFFSTALALQVAMDLREHARGRT